MEAVVLFCAKYLIALVALGGLVAVFYRKESRLQLFWLMAVSLPLAYALARLAGLLYSHPQPFAAEGFVPLIPHAVDNSFPSDHTLIAGVFASVAFIADWRAGLVLWALALLIGAARIAAGLHYLVDVAAAAALAAAAVCLAQALLARYKPQPSLN